MRLAKTIPSKSVAKSGDAIACVMPRAHKVRIAKAKGLDKIGLTL
jgi:hypothetical protein